jgi:Uncharacterized conserved small protein
MAERPSEPLPPENAIEPELDNELAAPPETDAASKSVEVVEEIGGPAGPDPTRFGDWERKGRCIDF